MAIKISTEDSIGKGCRMLKSRFLGGVTRESANEAIREVADDVLQKSENLLDEFTVKYIRQLNNKEEMILSGKRRLKEANVEVASLRKKLSYFLDKINSNRTFKKVKINPDGTEVFVKSNLNGARMKKTVIKDDLTGDEKLLSVTVSLPDGSVRRTSYNPVTGKPVQTFTNTNGHSLILYDAEGKTKFVKPVGGDKFASEKKPVSQIPEVIRNTVSEVETRQVFTDGSYNTTVTSKLTGEVLSEVRHDKSGLWNEKYTLLEDGTKVVLKLKPDETGVRVGFREISYPDGVNALFPESVSVDPKSGLRTFLSKILFPKTSPIKRIDIKSTEGIYEIRRSTIIMKNGDVYELSDFEPKCSADGKYCRVPAKIKKIGADNTETEIQKSKINLFLKSFGDDYDYVSVAVVYKKK